MVPTVLILTYFLLYLIPVAILRFFPWKGVNEYDKRMKSPLYGYITLLPYAGMGSDALSYIILTKRYRDNITKLYGGWQRKVHSQRSRCAAPHIVSRSDTSM